MACSKLAERFDLDAFGYAHRGLWSAGGPAENSLTAFSRAAAAKLGVELDVRPTSDGTPVVFHDPTLERMTAQTGFVSDLPAKSLGDLQLMGSNDTIPTLSDTLTAWNSDTPLLVELKIDGQTDAAAFAETVAAILEDHAGPAAAMSFDADAVRALPDTLKKGLLIAPGNLTGAAAFRASLSAAMEMQVDYLGVWREDAALAPQDVPIAVWTIASTQQLAELPGRPMGIIFEHFDPALVHHRLTHYT